MPRNPALSARVARRLGALVLACAAAGSLTGCATLYTGLGSLTGSVDDPASRAARCGNAFGGLLLGTLLDALAGFAVYSSNEAHATKVGIAVGADVAIGSALTIRAACNE